MEKYIQLEIGDNAFFMPWKDIIICDEIIHIHNEFFIKNEKKHKVTLYEFKHIQGKYRAYDTKEEIERVLDII